MVSLLLIAPIKMISFKFKSIILRGNELRYITVLLIITGLALFQRNFLPFTVPIYIIFPYSQIYLQYVKSWTNK